MSRDQSYFCKKVIHQKLMGGGSNNIVDENYDLNSLFLFEIKYSFIFKCKCLNYKVWPTLLKLSNIIGTP